MSKKELHPIGEWKIGEGDYFISFALTHKPNIVRRFFAWVLFGLRWYDFSEPRKVEELQPSKGLQVSRRVHGTPPRKFKK